MSINTCPLCGSTVSPEHFCEIQEKIRTEEKAKLAVTEATLRKKIEAEFAATRTKWELERKRLAADQQKLLVDRQQIAVDRKNLAAEREKAKVDRQKWEAETQRQIAAAKQQAERQKEREVKLTREALEKDRDESLLKQRGEFGREKDGFQRKISELQRQLQRKSAGDLGDGAEIDLYEGLREAFPKDSVTRIGKGRPGADILIDIMHRGQSCGRILIDSKNRQSWQHAYVTKLREDQTEARAQHAILSSVVFPTGKKELFVESEVIVASPGRVVALVELLRRAMVTLHIRGLGDKERSDKLAKLYDFITSPGYAGKIAEAQGLTQQALDLDVQEKRTHDNMWKRRGTVLTRTNHLLREIDTEVCAILETDSASDLQEDSIEAVVEVE